MPTTPKRSVGQIAAAAGWIFLPGVLSASDGSFAVATSILSSGDFLRCDLFGFTRAELPDAATVTGINIFAEGMATEPGPDNGLLFEVTGAFGDSADRSFQIRFPLLSVGIANVMLIANDENFLKAWGLTLKGIDVTSDLTFGCKIRTGNNGAVPPAFRWLDHIQMSIEYDDPAEGFDFHPVIRTDPDNGPSESFDLVALFPDSMGPTKILPGYIPIQERRTTISRRVVVEPRGYRPTCRFTFQAHDLARDHGTLATILSRLMDREWRVFLSLDGGEAAREVILSKNKGPKWLGRKQAAGAEYMIDLDAVEPTAELPALRRTGASNRGSW